MTVESSDRPNRRMQTPILHSSSSYSQYSKLSIRNSSYYSFKQSS